MSISLQKTIRSCSVNTGESERIQSDRFFNPNLMSCPLWNGLNNKGQEVCSDSFYTKSAGCNSAEDRVVVENVLRPKYMNYVTLGAQGIAGHIYGNNVEAEVNSLGRDKFDQSRNKHTGNFGLQFGANVEYNGCSVNAYERAMSQMNQQMRNQNYMQNGAIANDYRTCSGGY